jgi:hypothetical protein
VVPVIKTSTILLESTLMKYSTSDESSINIPGFTPELEESNL